MPSPLPRLNERSQKGLFVFLLGLALLLIGVGIYLLYGREQHAARSINATQLRQIGEAGQATLLSVDGELLTVTLQDGTQSQAVVTNQAAQHDLITLFDKGNVQVEYNSMRPGALSSALTWLIPLISFAIFGFVIWRVYASVGGKGGDFNPIDASGKQTVNFGDVAGVDEAKLELAETIEFLKDPAKFGRLGGRAPRGILLSGPPGTGKTLLARAAANEAGVPFLSASGSTFQEKFAGLGAARVKFFPSFTAPHK